MTMIKSPSIGKMTLLLILSGIACSISSFTKHPGALHPKQKSSPLRTIIIDPGHGGFDPGTKGLITDEKTVTLGISLKLGKMIEEAFPDIKIVYTRTTDV